MSKNKKIQRAQIKDTSPQIFQRDKIDYTFIIKELPWTEKQKTFIDLALNKNTKMIFIKGSAGTSKTLISMFAALQLLKQKRISDIILVRSAVESSENKLGYLPGDLIDKFSVYVTPFRDKLDELLTQDIIKKLDRDNRIQICPINFARGLHWAAKCILADELQNFSANEIKTLMTRQGKFSKMFLCGDPSQSDLTNNKSEGFVKVYDLFDNEEAKEQGIFTFEFNDEDDIMRSEVVRFIIKKFKDFNKKK